MLGFNLCVFSLNWTENVKCDESQAEDTALLNNINCVVGYPNNIWIIINRFFGHLISDLKNDTSFWSKFLGSTNWSTSVKGVPSKGVLAH